MFHSRKPFFFLIIFVSLLVVIASFPNTPKHNKNNNNNNKYRYVETKCQMSIFGGVGGGGVPAKIPSSSSDRDNKAINAIKAAINSPRSTSLPLIECEFPPLDALNKLGDGSLRSSMEVDKANINFATKLLKSIAPVPFLGPKTWLITSVTASKSFVSTLTKQRTGASIYVPSSQQQQQNNNDLLNNMVGGTSNVVCVFLNPSSPVDYNTAANLAAASNSVKAVVLINGLAKDRKSIPTGATMAYYLKPLTYNSQIAGFLIRSYPGPWTVLDAQTNSILATYTDNEILVRGTNTPDLRSSGRLVQQSVDERAIQARKRNQQN